MWIPHLENTIGEGKGYDAVFIMKLLIRLSFYLGSESGRKNEERRQALVQDHPSLCPVTSEFFGVDIPEDIACGKSLTDTIDHDAPCENTHCLVCANDLPRKYHEISHYTRLYVSGICRRKRA